jgi:excisionase family DNA binding protein
MFGNKSIPILLTVREVARTLYIHDNTARRWGDQGILQTLRINNRGDRRFLRDDVYRLRNELIKT